jgi:transcriptional regulator with GAF, ATPase, and Fis domain
VNVRIIAATHRDLAGMVQQRTFREDLWYRIAVFPILIPPLRERTDDIGPLARHFAERAAVRYGLAPVEPTNDDIRLLQRYPWPGNIRELAAVIDRAAILGDGLSLEVAAALGISPGAIAIDQIGNTPKGAATSPPAESLSLDDAIRRHVEMVLKKTRGRIEGPKGAAAVLQINPHTLRARMRKLGIDWSRFREE